MIQFSELQILLDSELDHCQLLQTVLLSERKLIETRQLDELPGLLRQKADLLSAIENCHSQRSNWLKSKNFETTLAEFAEAITPSNQSQSSAQPPLTDALLCIEKWKKLDVEKKLCNDHNTVNGIIIAKAKKRNGQQLELLKGINPGKKLYDAKGQPISSEGSQGSHIA